MSYTIAVSGKGGSGKSTLAALIVKALTEQHGQAVLVVDADPNSTLPTALGVKADRSVADIREDMMEKRVNIPPGVPKERVFEYQLHQLVLETPKFDLLVMGRPEGPKCYCYTNHLLRSYLDKLSGDYPYVVIDNEAGMEHLSRRTTDNVDLLVLVAQPTVIGLESVRRLLQLADELSVTVRGRVLVLNMLRSETLPQAVAEKLEETGFEHFFPVPEDREVQAAWEEGQPLLSVTLTSPAFAAVSALVREMLPVQVT